MSQIDLQKIKYLGFFVDQPSVLLEKFPPKHQTVFAHHSTNWYKPENLNDLEIGRKQTLKIIGRAFDSKGDALLVENPKTKNKFPHITLSCAEDVPPEYSNELLENASQIGASNPIEYFTEPFLVETTEGFCDWDDNITLSSETTNENH